VKSGGRNDFLAEMIAERTKANPDFPALVEAALNRRELLRALAAERQAVGLTQTELAAALGTSQAQVARLESGNADAKLSTISRLAAVLGKTIEFQVKDAPATKRRGARRSPTRRRTTQSRPR
jgi:ribosome-binding protein aMBF1 (putative translation factor)